MHWDDDDVHGPTRIAEQLHSLANHDVALLARSWIVAVNGGGFASDSSSSPTASDPTVAWIAVTAPSDGDSVEMASIAYWNSRLAASGIVYPNVSLAEDVDFLFQVGVCVCVCVSI
jgi:hypothetical protein